MRVIIPSALKQYASEKEVDLPGATVAECWESCRA